MRLIPRGQDSATHFLRSAYSLVLNTAATGILGVAFWVVAARLFPAETVGRDSVLIVTMMTLSTICQCNMPNLFVRFLPEQIRPARLILIGYGVSTGLAVVLGAIAMLVMPRVSEDLSGLGFDSSLGWIWMASLALWGVFTLQDAALTGLRHAPWVAGKNSLFGLLKLLSLPLFLALGATYGIFLAWVVPMVILLLPINAIVFGRATARHTPAQSDEAAQSFRDPAVRRFVILDYTAATFIQGLYTVLPLLVLAVLGSTENAYFWIPFSLITALDMMSLSVATSMTVEGAFARSELASLARIATRRFALLVLGGAAVLAVAAPIVLAPFGPDYVENGTGVLRVLTIGVVCHGVIELYVGVARVRQDGRSLALLGIARCVLALALCGVLGARYGIMGVAAGWSAMSIIVALAVLPPLAKVLGTTRTGAAAPVRSMLGEARGALGRVWTGSGRGERVALVSSVLGLVATLGILPAVVAFVLLLAFAVTAPGVVALALVRRLGPPPEAAAGLIASIGLAVVVLLAQSMLWLGVWYTRGWLGLLAVACLAVLATRALGRPMWRPGGIRQIAARAGRLGRRGLPDAPGPDVEGQR